MARIAGVDLPDAKRADIALTAIYGIGRSNVQTILKEAKVDARTRAKDLTVDEVARLSKVIERINVEGNLRKQIRENIQRLRRIATYRGSRHANNLPARGQRTKTNARTKRGKRATIGAIAKDGTK